MHPLKKRKKRKKSGKEKGNKRKGILTSHKCKFNNVKDSAVLFTCVQHLGGTGIE